MTERVKRGWRMGQWYKKIPFQRLLTMVMVGFVSVVFLTFSMIVTYMSESKIRENVKDNMSIVVEQFDVYLENHMSNIFKGFKSIESDQNLLILRNADYRERKLSYVAGSYLYMDKLLKQFLQANPESVYNVYLNFGNGKVLTQVYEKDLLKINYSYEAWKERFPDNQYYWVDADSCRDLVPDPEVGAVLFHLYGETEAYHGGMILIAIKQEFFENILNVEALSQEASLNLMTDYGIMEFGDREACRVVEDNRDYLAGSFKNGSDFRTERHDGYYFMYEEIAPTGWKLIYNVSESSISNADYIFRDIMLITVLTIGVSAVVLGFMARSLSLPLRILTKKVEDKEILEHEISLQSYVEITTLSNSLEHMRRRINHLLEQVEMEQESKRQIEIALLQEQINPHFLYNTLYSIMQLCELKQTKKASEMLDALSHFYRIGLSGGKSIVTVREELSHVKDYLFIQHFRYSDLFDYTIDCDPEILDCRIPKMSLQPLVENAIYHGIKMKQEFGSICILGGSYDGEYAYLEVHDDGPGMSEVRIREIREYLADGTVGKDGDKKISFGMKNVDSRIKFEFGAGSGLELESTPMDTCVRLRFCMERGEE